MPQQQTSNSPGRYRIAWVAGQKQERKMFTILIAAAFLMTTTVRNLFDLGNPPGSYKIKKGFVKADKSLNQPYHHYQRCRSNTSGHISLGIR